MTASPGRWRARKARKNMIQRCSHTRCTVLPAPPRPLTPSIAAAPIAQGCSWTLASNGAKGVEAGPGTLGVLGDASCSWAQSVDASTCRNSASSQRSARVLRTRWVALYTFCRICSLWLWSAVQSCRYTSWSRRQSAALSCSSNTPGLVQWRKINSSNRADFPLPAWPASVTHWTVPF